MNNYLVHYGVKGMKWGVRRYQNPDGSWKSEGLDHRRATYGTQEQRDSKRLANSVNKYISDAKNAKAKIDKFEKKYPKLTSYDDGRPVALDYAFANRQDRKNIEAKLDDTTIKLVQKYANLYDEFDRLSTEDPNNKNWSNYYDNSKKYIEKYGHKKFQDLLGDDANFYYTENWRTFRDDLVDYDSGNFYYRNLSEELW